MTGQWGGGGRKGEVNGDGNEIRLLAGFLIGIHKRSVSDGGENRFISYDEKTGTAILRERRGNRPGECAFQWGSGIY